MGDAPLAGTLVVEAGARIGAGVCGSLLARLGATTVLVEAPASEAFGDSKWRHRQQLALGKLSFYPDAASEADLDLLRRLASRCDALILSSDADGALVKDLALDRGTGAVVCDITAYGRTGDLAGRPDTDWQVQARSGIVDTTGFPDRPPTPVPIPVVEYLTGIYAAAATVAALRVRRQSGAGQRIDMALYDCAFAAMATFLPRGLIGNREPVRRAGNRHPLIVPWNVYRASNGWVLICAGSDVQWQRLCRIMGRSDLEAAERLATNAGRGAAAAEIDEAVQAWVGQLTVAACVERLTEAGIAAGAIVTIDGHPQEPNLDHRGMIERAFDPVEGREVAVPGSPLRMGSAPRSERPRLPAPDEDRDEVRRLAEAPAPARGGKPIAAPLAGIRVIEIGHYTTAPLAARHLASLGADVIKIEPPEGEATRAWPPTQRGQGYFFTYMNSDKRSLVLDLQSQEGAEVLRALVAEADVLIENLKPGALGRRGFTPAALARMNPRLVYCAVSGFGADSVYEGRPAFDSVIQAMSGIMDLVRADGVPIKIGISAADLLGAEMALLAVLAALEERERTGRGQVIDLSMQDAAAWMTQVAWNGRRAQAPAPAVIACADGFAVAAGTPADLLGTGEVEGAPEALQSRRSRSETVERLAARGVVAAPVLTVLEVIEAPQTAARALWFVARDGEESWPLMGSPLRLLGTPPEVRRPMPALGRDTDAILAALGRGGRARTTAR